MLVKCLETYQFIGIHFDLVAHHACIFWPGLYFWEFVFGLTSDAGYSGNVCTKARLQLPENGWWDWDIGTATSHQQIQPGQRIFSHSSSVTEKYLFSKLCSAFFCSLKFRKNFLIHSLCLSLEVLNTLGFLLRPPSCSLS